ncbi:MAG: hypothetical protein Q9207_000913 [Kuettlingeria erythrocarpa]
MKRKRSLSIETRSLNYLLQSSPSPPPQTPSLPLTAHNLQLLPGSPPERPDSSKTMSSGSDKFFHPINPDIPAIRRQLLQQHGLYINELDVYEANPEIQSTVEAIIYRERNSAMKPGSAKKIQTFVRTNETQPEEAIFQDLWRLVFKESREVETSDGWVPQEWKQDGFRQNPNLPFHAATVSPLELTSDSAKPYAHLFERLKSPKPDLCFGIQEAEFTHDELRMMKPVMKFIEIQTCLFFAFCIDEFKGSGGNIVEAEDQAARSGSTAVEAARNTQEMAGELDLDKPGADSENIIFSICMDPANARVFVHWALVLESREVEYHMTNLEVYGLLIQGGPEGLRRTIDNIVDWGLLVRKAKFKNLLPKIWERSTREVEEKAAHGRVNTHTDDDIVPADDKTHPDVPHNRRRILETHGLFINRVQVYEAHPTIKGAVDEVLCGERGSAMRQESAKKMADWILQNESEPEKVFFADVWGRIFKNGRQLKTDDGKWIPRDWKDDHFRCNPDLPFHQGTVTTLDLESPQDKNYAKLIDRVKNPKPDLCFGLAKQAFTDDEMRILSIALPYAEVSAGLYCAFSATEQKGPEGNMVEAEDQASRSGSTLVECTRNIEAMAGERDLRKPGVDASNIIFSICICQGNTRLYVHWALVLDNQRVVYHMNKLFDGSMMDNNKAVEFRRHLDNIVDWGLLSRKNRIKSLLPKIENRCLGS